MLKVLKSIDSGHVFHRCFQLAQASVPILLDLTVQCVFQTKVSSTSVKYFRMFSGIASLFLLSRYSHFPWKLSTGLYSVYNLSRIYFSRKTDELKKPPDITASQAPTADELLQKLKTVQGKLRQESEKRQEMLRELGLSPQNPSSTAPLSTPLAPSSVSSAAPSGAAHNKTQNPATSDQSPASPSTPPSVDSKASPPAAQSSSHPSPIAASDALAQAAQETSSPKPRGEQLRLTIERAQKTVQDFSELTKGLAIEALRHGKSITVDGAVIGGKKKDRRKCKIFYCDSHFFKLSPMRYKSLMNEKYNIPSGTLFFLMQIECDKKHVLETHFFPVSMLDSLNSNTKAYSIHLSEILNDKTSLKIELQFEPKQIQQLLTLKERLKGNKPTIEIADPVAPVIGDSMDGLGATIAAAIMQIGSTKCYLEPFKSAP